MRTIMAMLLVLGASQGAAAYCLPQPDNAASAYVLNGIKQSLCLSNELAAATAERNRAVAIEAALGSLQRQVLQQKLDSAIRQPVWTGPAWP